MKFAIGQRVRIVKLPAHGTVPQNVGKTGVITSDLYEHAQWAGRTGYEVDLDDTPPPFVASGKSARWFYAPCELEPIGDKPEAGSWDVVTGLTGWIPGVSREDQRRKARALGWVK